MTKHVRPFPKYRFRDFTVAEEAIEESGFGVLRWTPRVLAFEARLEAEVRGVEPASGLGYTRTGCLGFCWAGG